MPRSRVSLRLFRSPSNLYYERLVSERAVERMQAADSRARQEGLRSLDPDTDPMIRLGMEVSSRGRVTKNGFGVLHLPWLAVEHSEWSAQIEA